MACWIYFPLPACIDYCRPAKKKFEFDIDIVTTNGKPVKSFNQHPVLQTKSIATKQSMILFISPDFSADLPSILQQEKKDIAWLKNNIEQRTPNSRQPATAILYWRRQDC